MTVAVHLGIRGEKVSHVCEYASVTDATADPGLRTLFDDGLVLQCAIDRDGQRLCGIPFMVWERFESALAPYKEDRRTRHPGPRKDP